MEINDIVKSRPTFFHVSKNKLPVGKTIEYKGQSKGTFGDYEKILEMLRPADKSSRLSSFFLAKDKHLAEEQGQGDNLYKVAPVGKFDTHFQGWLGMLISLYTINASKWKTGYGYVIPNWKKHLSDSNVQYICAGYWEGKRPSAADIKRFDYEVNSETYAIEMLAPKIKIIKELE